MMSAQESSGDQSKIMIRNNGNEVLTILPKPKGVHLAYASPTLPGQIDLLRIGIGSESLKELKEVSTKETFKFELGDKSLKISGNNHRWTLLMRVPTNDLSISVALTEDETNMMKKQLWPNT